MMINTGGDCLHVIGAVGEEGALEGEAEKEVEAAPVPTEVHYSWHYYEREDQVEELFESLNIKGMRERKLQENLRKVKERLKLKKAKKVAAKPVPEEATQNAANAEKPTDQTAEGIKTVISAEATSEKQPVPVYEGA